MATDANSSVGNPPAAASQSSAAAGESYIGSLISLTSKSEIRYEGILYNINTDESSIGLRNVRSFGTEGRKKDGPQIPPSDKFYEYILFRGSDIKDLQVKSSPPVQNRLPLNNDPAIIQSHYPRPGLAPTSLPSAGSVSLTDLSPPGQLGLSGSNYEGALPLYQPGGNVGSWGASPSAGASGSGIGMPMYWQGYYGPPNGLPHMHQQPLLQPPTGMPIPPMQQPMQYPNFNASAPSTGSNMPTSKPPDGQPPLLPAGTGSLNVMATSMSPSMLSSNLPAISPALRTPETLPNSASNVAPIPSHPNASLNGPLTSPSPLISGPELGPVVPPVSNKTSAPVGQLPLYQPQSSASVGGVSNSVRTDTPAPSLVTPSQLTQPGSAPIASSQPIQVDQKDVEVVQVSSSSPTEHTVPVATEAQPPILPLPVLSRAAQKANGPPFQSHYGYRGRERGRGRGAGSSRPPPVTKFTEEFDFEAMNEKFNKDEVWGHLGKSSSTDKRENGNASDDDDFQEDEDELHKIEVKHVYNKDDFFDTLSCNALENDSHSGRTRFSEQLKIDTETFGEFARYRGGRGGRGPGRGGRSRGGYYGGYGYHGRGYGYGYGGRSRGRGRSRDVPDRAP